MSRLIFLLGGARSGKSRYAVQLAYKYGGENVAFIATAEASDDEMRRKIESHIAERPKKWITIEEPYNLTGAFNKLPEDIKLVIIDCMTLYVSNLMLKGFSKEEITQKLFETLKSIQEFRGDVIIISNEVGLSVVPENDLARSYRDILGTVNQIIASYSNCVYFMIAGLKLKIKGGCDE